MGRHAVEAEDMTGAALLRDVRRRLVRVSIVANVWGGTDLAMLTALLTFGAAKPPDPVFCALLNTGVGVAYLVVTLMIGSRWGRRLLDPVEPWMVAGRAPTAEERRHALRLPMWQTVIYGTFWLGGAVLLGLVNLIFVTPGVAAVIFATMSVGGVTTTAVGYLKGERILRPVIACALAEQPPERSVGPGVGARVVTVWVVATGVPLLGIAAIAVTSLAGKGLNQDALLASILFLAGVTIGVGLLATKISARSVAEPLAGMRAALGRIERGDFDARVPVDDGSEIGLLEAGFNRMATGLQEREQLHDLFGRHVGREVAAEALGSDVKLGGEVRDVAVLFIDLVGSTALASRLPPERVVALLNDFFGIVVGVVEAHGGGVNKFEGDAALCVFGAPVARADCAGEALAAARELRARLMDELPLLDWGIAVSAGPCVAGNIGAEARFEYTVIGDPVNEAARLCELAKGRAERLVASDAAVERAGSTEHGRWELGESTLLRGRDAPTRLATLAVDERAPAA
ncbi:MAG TPA: adenylate/guanylate cyclase domain-containing protein [Thermoleophilaceae bacterium]|jgi:adenylate cyclase